jgi:hypothetical protein
MKAGPTHKIKRGINLVKKREGMKAGPTHKIKRGINLGLFCEIKSWAQSAVNKYTLGRDFCVLLPHYIAPQR